MPGQPESFGDDSLRDAAEDVIYLWFRKAFSSFLKHPSSCIGEISFMWVDDMRYHL